MRALTASRRLVRSRPLSTISSSALTRYDGPVSSVAPPNYDGPVSSVAPPNFTHGRLADHNICHTYNQRFLSSTAASEGNDDDISIKSQATAEDMLLSKYTQITDVILKSATGSISDKLRHEALEAASYWTRQQTAEGADRAAEIFHRLYVAFCIPWLRKTKGERIYTRALDGYVQLKPGRLLAIVVF